MYPHIYTHMHTLMYISYEGGNYFFSLMAELFAPATYIHTYTRIHSCIYHMRGELLLFMY